MKKIRKIPPLDQAARAAGTDGVGGLAFAVASPPGIGRLVRVPFYPNVAPVPTTVTTFAGTGTVSAIHPVVFLNNVSTFAAGDEVTLITPIVAWAKLRTVGFETLAYAVAQNCGNGDAISVYADGEVGPGAIVANLRIGGGANLFTHGAWADARMYDADFPEFVGLREYPVLHTPNQATVVVNQVGPWDPAAGSGYRTTFSCNLLCEVLVDDRDGAHIPGPYARAGALVRQPVASGRR